LYHHPALPRPKLLNMKEFINHINEKKTIQLKRIEECQVQIRKLNTIIEAFQDYCLHKNSDGSDAMKFRGHDSHKHYYQCDICGFEVEE
jgi:hypothetical protein